MTLLLAASRRGARGPDPLPPPPYAIPAAFPFNVSAHLLTPTYDGSDSTVHPDVIDFWTAHGIPSWNGYRFWMAHTPYPFDNDRLENPSILVSHDGVTWVNPTGVRDPLYPPPSEVGWNADTDLSYDPTTGELVLVYLAKDVGWMTARSANGTTWPESPTVMTFLSGTHDAVSPAVVRMADGTWRMWAVSAVNRALWQWSSPDADGPWSFVSTYTGLPTYIWHLDVVRVGSTLYALIAGSGLSANSNIYVSKSTDNGASWSSLAAVVILGLSGRWDRTKLYRGTLQPHENGTHMRVWYCGQSPENTWRVGMTHVPLASFDSL